MGPGPELKSGVETSEYQVSRAGSLFGTVMTIAGGILAILPQVIEQMREVPGITENKYGMLALTILGGVVSVAGIVVKLSNDAGYVQGRSLVKAA